MTLEIRPARPGEEGLVHGFIVKLADYEKLLHEVTASAADLREGLFGAQAAARHYFRIDARQLNAEQAARLAVMLPAPKRFEKRPASPYLLSRAAVIEARMGGVEVP